MIDTRSPQIKNRTSASKSTLRIGLTYDVKVDGAPRADLPDDFQEEFDSPATIEAIAAALRGLGHEVEKLGDGPGMLRRLLDDPPDFVFNLAEGEGIGRSREARVPGVLEMLGIPYTGSDPLTLAVTLDKDCAKRLVQSAGVAVPRGCIVEELTPASIRDLNEARLLYPLIAKPAWEGSSKGIRNKSLARDFKELEEAVRSVQKDHNQPVLIEEFIEGDELTVGLIGNHPPQVIAIMRVLPKQATKHFVYGLEVKRDYLRRVTYECPAQLPAATLEAVQQAALEVFRILGCRDVARVDFRLRDGVPYFLEVNPLPGLSPETSDLVILAKLAGWTYSQVIEAILQAAMKRQQPGKIG